MARIEVRCKATGTCFTPARDTKAAINGARLGWDWAATASRLWKEHGPESFEFCVARELKYDDPAEDHSGELEELLEQCLAEAAAKL